MTGFIRHLKSLDCYKIAVDSCYTVFKNMMKTVEKLFIRGVSEEIGYSLDILPDKIYTIPIGIICNRRKLS